MDGRHLAFSSAENLDAFKTKPEKYAPQYGGYCAFGTSQGHLVPGGPQAWKIVDNKLYLNYNKDVLGFWLQDVPGNIQKADNEAPVLLPGVMVSSYSFASQNAIAERGCYRCQPPPNAL